MSYDRADWHYDGKHYPKDLPRENGGTHIGMFLAWAIINGFDGEEHQRDCPESLADVRARRMTGREFLFRECDGKLWEADLSEEGNAFAKYYYAVSNPPYIQDYVQVLAADLPDAYYVEDSWGNFDKIAAMITNRFNAWKGAQQ